MKVKVHWIIDGVAEIEASTDLAIAEVMYRAASKYGIKYIFEGHSFVTEGITPLGRNYFDGKYISSIHKFHNLAGHHLKSDLGVYGFAMIEWTFVW